MAFAVFVPVAIFVFGPRVAQAALDNTVISLPNLTQAACPANYTWLFNTIKFEVPESLLKISSTTEAYEQETWITACDKDGEIKPGAQCGKDAIEYQMGRYMSPAFTASPGVNIQNYTVVMKSNGLNSSVVLSAWVVPLFVLGEKVKLVLKAKNMKVKTLGITFSGLTMRTALTCRKVGNAPVITLPNSVCFPDDPKHEPYTTQEYWVACDAGFQDDSATTTTTKSPAAAVVETSKKTRVFMT